MSYYDDIGTSCKGRDILKFFCKSRASDGTIVVLEFRVAIPMELHVHCNSNVDHIDNFEEENYYPLINGGNLDGSRKK